MDGHKVYRNGPQISYSKHLTLRKQTPPLPRKLNSSISHPNLNVYIYKKMATSTLASLGYFGAILVFYYNLFPS